MHIGTHAALQWWKGLVAGLQVWVSRHILEPGIRWDQIERRLHSVRHLLWHNARADGWAVRRASTVITGAAVISQAERSYTKHFLIEAIHRSLQRRVARRVGVKGIGTDKVRRRSHGGDVRVFRWSSSMALELGLGPVTNLTGKKRGLGP